MGSEKVARSLAGLFKQVRLFHSGLRTCGSEAYEGVNEMLENRYTPPANIIEKRPYTVPHAIFSSYRQQRRDPDVRFRDVAIVKLKSGDGGNGKVSFLREAGRAMGPPDGGDGGTGGHVFVQAVEGMTSLHHLRHIYKAANGRGGGSTQLSGKNGENVVLQVPVGTVVRWSPPLDELKRMFHEAGSSADGATEVDIVTNLSRFDNDSLIQLRRDSYADGQGWLFKEQEEEHIRAQQYFRQLIPKVRHFDTINRRREAEQDTFPYEGIDLDRPGQSVMLLAGGNGGLGNMHFLTGDIRNPRFAKQGRSGLESTFIFELRLLADLGLVGLPNAGKSSLLRAISRARPRVGHWEFTTLTPTIGTIQSGLAEPSFTVADIPGIIEGAHENRGLGLGFLRHVERSGGLVFVIALDRPDPAADFQVLVKELGPKRMEKKRILVIATKADVPESQERYQALKEYLGSWCPANKYEWEIVPCSAQDNGNIESVIQMMAQTAGKTSQHTTRV